MPIYQNQTDYNQFNQNNASSQGYDLAAEKQRIAEGTEEIKKELQEKWQQRYGDAQIFPSALSDMSQGLLAFLLSFEHTLFYDELARKFNLSEQQRNFLPQIVWHLCQNKNWENLAPLLQKNLQLTPAATELITQSLTSQILSKAKELSSGESTSRNQVRMQEEARPSLLQMSLTQALKEIPELGEQLLTSERIHILSFPEPVRPSLKNWLADYTSFFGYTKHSPIEMGNYLFHSENTKKLSSSDRQKLTYILKAFNDETPVNINKTLKQVVFPSISTPTNQIRNSNIETRNNNQAPNSNFQNNPAQPQTSPQNTRYQLPNTNTQAPFGQQIRNPKSEIRNNNQIPNSNFQNRFEDTNYKIQETNKFRAPNTQTPVAQEILNSNVEARNNIQTLNSNLQTGNLQQIRNNPQDTKYQIPNTNSKIQDTEGLVFSSPHTLPYEQEKETPQEKPTFATRKAPGNLPTRPFQQSTPARNTIVLEKKPDPPRPSGRNVVDLRESQ